MDEAIQAHPDSEELLKAYAKANLSILIRTYANEPAQAKARAERIVKRISGQENGLFKAQLRQIKMLEPRIESFLKLKELVGQAAPPLDVDRWVQGGKHRIVT